MQFHYIKAGVKKAQEEGFTPYVDFPDTTKVYTEKVLDVFGQRLIKTERSDIQKYLDFWNISKEYQNDKFYLLAYTQGMLSTDNFEFLADFHPKNLLRPPKLLLPKSSHPRLPFNQEQAFLFP